MPQVPSSRRADADTDGRDLPRDLLKVLGDSTRQSIHLALAESPRPLTAADLAEALDLHPNTVRPHLDRMREVGLVEVHTGTRGGVGRPQHRYSLAADAPSLGLEPPIMPVLARLVLSMAARLGASADDAAAVGADEGRQRAARYRTAPSTLEAVVSDLDRLGFDPHVLDGGAGTAVVAFAHCPFGDLAERHPELVCGVHRGLVSGFVDGMGDAELVEFCSLADRTPCQATLR